MGGDDKNRLYTQDDLQKDSKDVSKRRTSYVFGALSSSTGTILSGLGSTPVPPSVQAATRNLIGFPINNTFGSVGAITQIVPVGENNSVYFIFTVTDDIAFVFDGIPLGKSIEFVIDITIDKSSSPPPVITLDPRITNPPTFPVLADNDRFVLSFTGANYGGSDTFTYIGGTISEGGGIGTSPLTTKGDLYTFATQNVRFPVGTAGQILSADSMETTGLSWIDPPSVGLPPQGTTTVSHALLSDGAAAYWGTLVNIRGQINARTQIAGGAAIIGKILSATIDGTAWIDPPSSSLPPQSSATAEHALVSNGVSAYWGTLANIAGNLSITQLATVATDANHVLISGGGTGTSGAPNYWGTLANIEGNLPASKITSGVFDIARIPEIPLTSIASVDTDVGHVIVAGGSLAENYWGTLANIAGNLSITSIGTVKLNANHVLISGGTVVPNFWGTLANIAGNLAASKITSGVFDIARIPEIPLTSIASVDTDVGHVIVAGGSLAENYWGTLANIAGNLSITSIGTVKLNANHVLISGGTVVPNFWGTLANIAGNLAASKITSGVFDIARIPEIPLTSIASVDTDVGHVIVAGGSLAENYWGTLANIAGNLSITSISTVSEDANHVLISGGVSADNYWGTLPNIEGNLPASKITSGVFDIARIPEIPLTSIASVDTDVSHVIVAGGDNADNYWGTLANITGKLPLASITASTSDNDKVLQVVAGVPSWESSGTGGLATDLSNLAATTVPPHDLKMNNHDLLQVGNLDFDAITSSILGLVTLSWSQTGQNIKSIAAGIVYTVAASDTHSFIVDTTEIMSIGSGTINMIQSVNMNNHIISDLNRISFNTSDVTVAAQTGIGYESGGGGNMIYGVVSSSAGHKWRISTLEVAELSRHSSLGGQLHVYQLATSSIVLAGVLAMGSLPPTSPGDGFMWYNTSDDKFQCRQAGTTYDFVGSGVTGANIQLSNLGTTEVNADINMRDNSITFNTSNTVKIAGSSSGLAYQVPENFSHIWQVNNLIVAQLQSTGFTLSTNTSLFLNSNYAQFREISSPTRPSSNLGRMYAKDVGGVTTPFWYDSAGNETSMIGGGATFPVNFPELDGGTVTGNVTIDMSASTRHARKYVMGADVTLQFTNPPTAAYAVSDILVVQDSTGGRQLTLPASIANRQTVQDGILQAAGAETGIVVVYRFGAYYAFLESGNSVSGGSGGAGLAVDLSNLAPNALPPVDLSMNGKNITNIDAIIMLSGGVFHPTSLHTIGYDTTGSGTLTYNAGGVSAHQFRINGETMATIVRSGSSKGQMGIDSISLSYIQAAQYMILTRWAPATTPQNGTIWYDSASSKFKARQAGTTYNLIGGGTTGGLATDLSNLADPTAPNVDIAMNKKDVVDVGTLEFTIQPTAALSDHLVGMGYETGTSLNRLVYSVASAVNIHEWRSAGVVLATLARSTSAGVDGVLHIDDVRTSHILLGGVLSMGVGTQLSPAPGQLWYDTTDNMFKARQGSTTYNFVGAATGGLATDLSNLADPTAPNVDIAMNKKDVVDVGTLEFTIQPTAALSDHLVGMGYETGTSLNRLVYSVASAVNIHEWRSAGVVLATLARSTSAGVDGVLHIDDVRTSHILLGGVLSMGVGTQLSPAPGQLWYDTTDNMFKARQGSTTYNFVGSGAGGANIQLSNLGTTALNANINMRSNSITFHTSNAVKISGTSTGLLYQIPEFDVYSWEINNDEVASLYTEGFKLEDGIPLLINENYAQFREISTPSRPSSDNARMYAKDVGGVTTPFWYDRAGNETSMIGGGGTFNPGNIQTNLIPNPDRRRNLGSTGQYWDTAFVEYLMVYENAIIGSVAGGDGNLEINGDLNHDGSRVGFYSKDPVSRQVIGSLPVGSSLATTVGRLRALLTDLDNLGLIRLLP